MVNNIIFLKPILVHKEWGTNDFKKYGYFETEINAGELILLSDNEYRSNLIVNSSNWTNDLHFLYKHNKKFYNSKTGNIPIQIKIINTSQNLDINFSPSNYYSRSIIGKRGSKKYWISLENNEHPNILYGRREVNEEELRYCLENKDFENLTHQFNLNQYEGIYINENTIHSLNQNSLIYEISLKDSYEYNLSKFDLLNQVEKNHILKSIYTNKRDILINKQNNENCLINNKFFKIQIVKVSGIESFNFKDCTMVHVFVNQGSGKVNEFNISKGSNFIIKGNIPAQFIGTMDIIITYIFDF